MDECAVVVSEVHCKREAVTAQAPMAAMAAPNQKLFLAVGLFSFAACLIML